DNLPAQGLRLLGSLSFFVRLGRCPRAFGLGLLFGGLALRVGLVLLSLALPLQVVPAGDHADHLFCLTLHTFDDALDGFFRARIVVAHETLLFCGEIPPQRSICSRCTNSPNLAVAARTSR